MLELQQDDVANEAQLIHQVRAGDTVAFDTLVRRHMKQAFATAYRILGQREDAEDLVQEAFVAALQHIDSFDTTRRFRPWLLRIVVNRALNARQSRERHRTETIPDHTAANIAPPSAMVEQHEMQQHIRHALDNLPERQRTIVQLAGFDELNSHDIAEILHIPAGTVRWELHQARRALRSALTACRGT